MKKFFRKLLCVFISALTIVSMCAVPASAAELNQTSVKLPIGYSTTLKVSGTGKTVTWSSADSSVAKIKSSDKSSAKIVGVKTGTTYIYAKVGSTKLKCKVYVRKTFFGASEDNVTLQKGDKEKITITVKGSKEIALTNSDKSVCGTSWGSWNGNSITLTLTAKKAGTATIKVYAKGYSKSAYKTIKVTVRNSGTTNNNSGNVNYYYGDDGNVYFDFSGSWSPADNSGSTSGSGSGSISGSGSGSISGSGSGSTSGSNSGSADVVIDSEGNLTFTAGTTPFSGYNGNANIPYWYYYDGKGNMYTSFYGPITEADIYGTSGGSSSGSSSGGSSSGSSSGGSSSGSGSSGSSSGSSGVSTEQMIADVVKLVNQERAAQGLSPLTNDPTLNKAAAVRAKELTQTFDHTRPDGSSCFTVLKDYGVSSWTSGENIAAGQRSADSVMDSWMNSSGHRANILKSDFTSIGVGVYYDPSSPYGYYWVQIFTG